MRLLALTCDHCGAPLEVPKQVSHFTCAYCETPLTVQHQGGAIFTATMEGIEKNTRAIAEDVDVIRAHHDLERLDQEWSEYRERYVRGSGLMVVPSTRGVVLMAIAMTIVGATLFVGILAFEMPSIVAVLFAIVYPIGAILVGIGAYANGRAFTKEFRAYRNRRRAIMQRLRDEG